MKFESRGIDAIRPMFSSQQQERQGNRFSGGFFSFDNEVIITPGERMSDLLNVILASDKRRNLLILLNSGPKGWDEIKQTLMVTSTGMLPQVKILEEEHLIERDGKKFYLTPIGKVLTRYMEPLVRTTDVFDKNKR